MTTHKQGNKETRNNQRPKKKKQTKAKMVKGTLSTLRTCAASLATISHCGVPKLAASPQL